MINVNDFRSHFIKTIETQSNEFLPSPKVHFIDLTKNNH